MSGVYPDAPARRYEGTSPQGVPYPSFTKLGQILGKPAGWVEYASSLNAADGPFGFGVIDTHAVGRTDLTYRYYGISSSDHMPNSGAGGLYVAGSNNPAAGWTWLNSGSAVIDATDLQAGDGDQLEAAFFIDYNPHIDRFVVYPHTEGFSGPTGTEQVTGRIITNDFVTWTPEGVDGDTSYVVISGQGNHHGYGYGTRINGKLLLHHRVFGNGGFLEGASIAIDAAGSEFVPLYEYRRPGAIQVCLDDPEDVLIGAHQPFYFAGQWWGLFNVRTSAGQAAASRDESIYIAPLADDLNTITGPPVQVIAQGGTGAIDEATAHAPCVLIQNNALYIYYSAIDSSNTQVVAVARCRINTDGSYDRYVA